MTKKTEFSHKLIGQEQVGVPGTSINESICQNLIVVKNKLMSCSTEFRIRENLFMYNVNLYCWIIQSCMVLKLLHRNLFYPLTSSDNSQLSRDQIKIPTTDFLANFPEIPGREISEKDHY